MQNPKARQKSPSGHHRTTLSGHTFATKGVTVRHSSIGRQPNFAALNKRRHLYSAGRPSRWALAHILVLNVMDFLMRRTIDGRDYSIKLTWGTGKLTDLDFADNTALISDSPAALQNMINELQGNAAKVGLWISAEKMN